MLSNTSQITFCSGRQHSPTAAALSTNKHLSEKCDFCVFVLPGSAEAQVIWGGTAKCLLTVYFTGNISAKNYQNPFMCVKVIACQRWDVFFRDTVWNCTECLLVRKCFWSHPIVSVGYQLNSEFVTSLACLASTPLTAIPPYFLELLSDCRPARRLCSEKPAVASYFALHHVPFSAVVPFVRNSHELDPPCAPSLTFKSHFKDHTVLCHL